MLLRQGLPITQGTVHLFLTGGNFLVNEIMMSYFMNSIEFIKIGTTDTRLVFFFSWFKRKIVERQSLQITILRGVVVCVCPPGLTFCHYIKVGTLNFF